MSRVSQQGIVFDAGPFIATERRNKTMVALYDRIRKHRIPVVTSAGVVAQIWRDGSAEQTPVALMLRHTTVIDLTANVARLLGKMLALTGTSDPIDAHIAFLARERGWSVLTSDASDIAALDPTLHIERI
jgi:predicted nucleic acid-binding protein